MENTHRRGTKIAEAAKIFGRYFEREPRASVLARFRESVGLSTAAAATYYQNLRVQNPSMVFQKRKTSKLRKAKA